MAEASAGGIGGFIGNSVGEAAAFAAGLAIGPLLEPIVQAIRNETWQTYPDRPLDPEVAAELVVENAVPQATGAAEANLTGMSAARFASLVETIRTAPGVPEARTLRRRALITCDQLHHAYEKAKIEPQYWAALDAILNEPLPPAVAALAAVRGLIDAEGTLPVGPPDAEGVVRKFPVYPISGKAAAAAAGYSDDAYSVMVGINGRPMSLHEAASAYFRGIIKLVDYQRAVSEGDTRNEWRDAILEEARQISTAHDAVENHLRGYSDEVTMYARAARHGMSQDDATILFQNAGRPLVPHQIRTGLARGAAFHPQPGELTDPYEASAHEANVKPAYYDLYIANQDTYPPLFQLNALVKAGAASPEQAADWSNKNGIATEVITALTAYWESVYPGPAGVAAPSGPSSLVKSQTTAAVTALRKAYVGGALDRVTAGAYLQQLDKSAAEQTAILAIWDINRQIEGTTFDTTGGTPH